MADRGATRKLYLSLELNQYSVRRSRDDSPIIFRFLSSTPDAKNQNDDSSKIAAAAVTRSPQTASERFASPNRLADNAKRDRIVLAENPTENPKDEIRQDT